MATPEAPLSLPCLVLDHGAERRPELVAVSDGARRACDAEELRGTRSWPTSHGWVLAWDPATAATFLWNPRAPGEGSRVALPPLEQPPPAESVCALSASPAAGAAGCTVVLVEPPEETVLWYCHAGSAAWTRHEYDVGGSSIRVPEGDVWCKRAISRLASCGGRFYYFHSATEYGVIDFPEPGAPGPPAFGTVPMKKLPFRHPAGQYMAMASVYPLDIGGELYNACVVHHRCDANSVANVSVFRMDFAKRRPVRVRSIGDRAILAGSSGRFGGWCPATEFGLLPNTVYWLSPEVKRLHVCDTLEQESKKCSSLAKVPPSHRGSRFG